MNDEYKFNRNVTGRTVKLLRERGVWASYGCVSYGCASVSVPHEIGSQSYNATFDSVAKDDGPAACSVRFFERVMMAEVNSALGSIRNRHSYIIGQEHTYMSCTERGHECLVAKSYAVMYMFSNMSCVNADTTGHKCTRSNV